MPASEIMNSKMVHMDKIGHGTEYGPGMMTNANQFVLIQFITLNLYAIIIVLFVKIIHKQIYDNILLLRLSQL